MNTDETIRHFIAETFYVSDIDELGDDVSLVDRGIVDSTGFLELTAFLESAFDIAIADSEIVPANLDTVGRITVFVERKRATKAA